MKNYYFTSESVTEGHPDKICDQISDGILDAILARDPNAHVACEVAITTGMVLIMGEISSDYNVDMPKIARDVISDIGYNDSKFGFDSKSCAVITAVDKQSADIAMGVNKSTTEEMGAGDQGMVFGYACDETPEYMPLAISLAHKLSQRLSYVRRQDIIKGLGPDGKSQVTVEYENDIPKRIDTIIISAQHSEALELTELRDSIIEHVISCVVPESLIDKDTKIFVNPTGRFVIGGPKGDSGLTGRKIIVDTYGGYGRHGGGAFSGKDPSKVDRSGAYMARYIAKNIVSAKLAKKCEVQISYGIGLAEPVSVMVNTFGTGKYSDEDIEKAVRCVFDMRPGKIVEYLDLRKPIYEELAVFGHMGREDLNLKWEETDRVKELNAFFVR
ncbi:MAG: methionine adenosyltransferase [Ruminococcaceae bacterium]|nr:methionine adenosyltransferase [Oscillospiraceae bacterium]